MKLFFGKRINITTIQDLARVSITENSYPTNLDVIVIRRSVPASIGKFYYVINLHIYVFRQRPQSFAAYQS